MKDDMVDSQAKRSDTAADIDAECQAWDWARTAGVSAEDLREALKESMGAESGRRLPRAA